MNKKEKQKKNGNVRISVGINECMNTLMRVKSAFALFDTCSEFSSCLYMMNGGLLDC